MSSLSSRPVCLALVLVTAAVANLPVVGNEFVLDDRPAIITHPVVRGAGPLWDVLETNYWGSQPHLFPVSSYRPLTTFTFVIQARLHGLQPHLFHAVNLLLHLAVCWLVFALVECLFRKREVALLAALLFAVHPVHTEAIAGAANRSELLCSLFHLAALLNHIRFVRQGRPLSAGVAVACFACSLLSKESGVTFLATSLLVSTLLWRGGADVRRCFSWRLYSVYLAAVLLFLGLRHQAIPDFWGQATSFVDNPLVAASFGERMVTALKILGVCTILLVYPVKLTADYTFDQLTVASSVFEPMVVLGLCCAGGAVALALWCFRSRPLYAFGALFFLVTYALVSNVLFVNTVIFAERLLYLPALGVCVLAAGFADVLLVRARALRLAVAALVSAVVILLGARSFARCAEWRDALTLYTSTVAISDRSARAHHNLGVALARRSRLSEALVHLQRSIEIYPDIPEAHANLGRLYDKLGRPAAAAHALNEAAIRQPKVPSRWRELCLLETRGKVLQLRLAACRRAADLQPQPKIMCATSAILMLLGRVDEAMANMLRTVHRFPNSDLALATLAALHLQRGQKEQALRHARRALAINPRNSTAARIIQRLQQ